MEDRKNPLFAGISLFLSKVVQFALLALDIDSPPVLLSAPGSWTGQSLRTGTGTPDPLHRGPNPLHRGEQSPLD